MAEDNSNANQQQVQPFEIRKVYLKDFSYESPMSPDVFVQQYKPALSVDFTLDHRKLEIEADPDSYEATVRVTATCKQADDDTKTYFVCEVKYAGVFAVRFKDLDLRHALEAVCPTVLFPYASERIGSMIAQGGFPPVMRPPVNFELLFAQKLQQEQQQQNGAAAQAPANS